MNAEEIARELGKASRSGEGWKCVCPAHADETPSLSLTDAGGRLLWRCHAGCDQERVREALQARGLLPNGDARGPYHHAALGEPSASWAYKHADGRLAFVVARYETPRGKEIRPWRPNGAGFEAKAIPAPRPLYRLPELVADKSKPVLVVEGEKSADAAAKILTGFAVTTWPGGADATKHADLAPLRDREVIVWPDADNAGRKAAAEILARLAGLARKVAVLEIDGRPEGWDVADAVAEGYDVASFIEEHARTAEQAPGAEAKAAATPAPVRLSWRNLSGRTPPPRAWAIEHWLGFYLTLIAGRGMIGKTLLAQLLGTSLGLGRDFIDRVALPLRVLLWACEDDHDELWRRQLPINDYFGIGMEAIDGKFMAESRIGCDNVLFSVEYGRALWTPVYDQLREQVNDERIDVLFLDNIGQTYAGNKADEHTVTRFGNGLSGLVAGRPFCPAMLGHPARAQGSEFSGAAAWENVARMRWYLGEKLPDQKDDDADPSSDVRYLAKRKTNYTAKDYRRFTYTNGVLVPDAPELVGPPGIVDAIRRRNAERAVLEAIPWLGSRNLAASHTPASRGKYLPRLMAEHKIDAGFSTKELHGAMTLLISEKRLLVDQEIGRSPHRKPVLGLALPNP